MGRGSRLSRRIAAATAVVTVAGWGAGAGAAPTTTLQNPLVRAVDCAECHEFVNPLDLENDPPVSPMLMWRGTIMANAARDPVFWAGIAVASQDAAADKTGLLTDATELCVRCHSPRAFLEGNGLAISQDELTFEQREGIECEVCHRMYDDGVTPPGNAQYVLDDVLVGPDTVPRRGPWSYDPDAPEEERPGHPTIEDPYTGSSRMCGTCHDVTTPRERVDENGDPMGMPFNEQRTYSEWRRSDLSRQGDEFRSCQDCHMPAVSDAAGCQDFFEAMDPELLHDSGARRHDLVGANRVMLTVLRDLYGAGEVPSEHFGYTLDRIDSFLGTAAQVEMSAPEVVDLRQGLEIDVRITNQTGHKLPTGYSEGRVAWIEVTATYAGTTVYSSGKWDDEAGRQDDEQLRTYEAIAEDAADGTELHLLLNNRWIVDNRIPPKGLTPHIETDPVGDRYALQQDGTWPNFDEVSYAFPPRTDVEDETPQNANDGIDVSVRLLYLINTREYLEFLRDENVTNDAGEFAWDAFADVGGATPVVLGQALMKLPVYGLAGQPDPPMGTTGTGTDGTFSDGGLDSGAFDETDTDVAPQDDASGCGCRTHGPGAAWTWTVLLLLVVARRRRLTSADA